jgi:hypothetical protein
VSNETISLLGKDCTLFDLWFCVCFALILNQYYESLQTQHNRRNDPSLWDILAHRWNHMKTEAQQFPSNNNLKHLMMTILVEACSVK